MPSGAAPPPTTKLQNLQSLRYATADAAFATVFGSLVGGAFLIGFIKQELNASDIWVGILSAIPALMGILQIPGGIIGQRFSGYKLFSAWGGLLWRLFYVPFIFLPLLDWPDEVRLLILTASMLAASASVSVVVPTATAWLAELIPQNSRGWFFGRRTAISNGIAAVVGILAGVMLDAFRGAGAGAIGYSVIFGFGIFFAALSLIFYLKMRDVPQVGYGPRPLLTSLKDIGRPFADPANRILLTWLGVFVFGQAFAGNLFNAYAIESLELPFTAIQIYSLSHAAAYVVFASFWGKLADKYGSKPILTLTTLVITLTPLGWLLTMPGNNAYNLAILVFTHIFAGMSWSAWGALQFNLLLHKAPPEHRSAYIGAGLATTNIIMGISPLLGALMMTALRNVVDPVTAYKWVFVACAALRLFSLVPLRKVEEEGAIDIRETVRHLRRVSPKGISAAKRLSVSADASDRELALRQVSDKRFTLAADEVLAALSDPSPSVRREATLAVTKFGDKRATALLLEHMRQHPELIEEETVEALGQLGDKDAVPELIELLDSPRALIRRAAAKALGSTGDSSAIPALVLAARAPGDSDLRRAAIQSLRKLDAESASEAICEALYDDSPGARVAAAEAIIHMELSDSAEDLRQAIVWFTDDSRSEAAYALGVVGSVEDIPTILKVASECVSDSARKRALLGVARILGLEREAYRLLTAKESDRDREIMRQFSPYFRRHPFLRQALEATSEGDDAQAIAILKESCDDPVIQSFTNSPMPEATLIAALRALYSCDAGTGD